MLEDRVTLATVLQ